MTSSNVPNLKKLTKDELLTRDIFGRTVLHISILMNDYECLNQLTKNPEFKSILHICDYENGWNCMHYIIFYKRLQCFIVLIQYLQTSLVNLFAPNGALVELLKCKDRCGYTCMQLLDHDLSSMRSLPEFIDVRDTYNWRSQDDPIPGTKELFLNTKIPKDEEHDVQELQSQDTTRGGSDIYVIGCNSNSQLGLGDSKDRSQPLKVFDDAFINEQNESEILAERFCKPRYKKMVISKNHAAVLTADGDVFTCGVGSRGRLGHDFDDLTSAFKFRRVEFFHNALYTAQDVAISSNHSAVLTSDGDVYAWGMNGFNQLGVNTPSTRTINSYLDDWIATPVLVAGELRKNKTKKLLGVDVSKIHSVTWTKNELYFWGLNTGQMGIQRIRDDIEVRLHDESVKGEIQTSPRSINLRDDIKCVSTSELCTCVVTVLNDIHVYYNFQHYKLPKVPVKGLGDKNFDLFKPRRLTEGTVITKIVTRGPYSSMILLSNGSIMSFTINSTEVKNTKYSTVWKPQHEDMKVIDFDMGTDGSVVLCTKAGSVFLKLNQSSQRRSSMSGAVLPISVNKHKFKKIENVNRIVSVACDPKFLSFGFIRDENYSLPMEFYVNDFIADVRQLSPMCDMDLYRKQDQLLDDGSSVVCSDKSEIDWILMQTESFLLQKFGSQSYDSQNSNKLYDAYIRLDNDQGVFFHKDFLCSVSPKFNELIKDDGNQIVGKKFSATWNPLDSCLEVTSKTQLLTVLLFVQSVYMGSKVDLWSNYGSRSRAPERLKLVFDEFDELCSLFNVSLGPKQLRLGFSNMLTSSTGTIKFKLKDGEMFAHAYLLRVRSAFFETILSERWGVSTPVALDFTGLTRAQMGIVLRHIYGVEDKDLLNCYSFKFDESEAFINEALEMIEIADELLLFQLKAVFEIAVAELISIQNVLSLTVNADYISARKLFLQCCWFIHHNLEVLLYDPMFLKIPMEILEKIQNCFDLESSDGDEFSKSIPNGISVLGFVSDLNLHNEYYMSDRKGFSSFAPLVDPRLEAKKPKETTKRRRSRKSSTLNTDIVDFRRNLVAEGTRDSPAVIEEEINNEFIEVAKKPRSKSQTKNSMLLQNGDLCAPSRKTSVGYVGKSDAIQSKSVESDTQTKHIAVTSQEILSPRLTWATSPPSKGCKLSDRSTSQSPEPFALMGNMGDTKQFKPKMGPHVKLSQKERKKLAAAAAASASASSDEPKQPTPKHKESDVAPWSAVAAETTTRRVPSPNFPALGAKRVKSPSSAPTATPSSRSAHDTTSPMVHANSSTSSLSSIYSTPSLAEVMRGESLKQEPSIDDKLPKKSLAEIQKEQEFEKWWQEESRKVQQELGVLKIDDQKSKSKKRTENGYRGSFQKNQNGTKKEQARSNGTTALGPGKTQRKLSNGT
ncbi:hypothetical protein CANMA_003582 [Candida margitis]|uniref:uncharacterized protein n=1 Tax=Candida margitis TaxID=1775924 RepID=UPI00222601ED|nr:uncharacterized protein CANMA_003582 [Candida margitis]KAI5963985.1 hypothetical protein CANMA_003582 [Candida margitis]